MNNIKDSVFDPIFVVESPLKYSTSAICCFADGKGYAVGSIEGRIGIVNVNFNNIETVDLRDFCYKCHRIESKD